MSELSPKPSLRFGLGIFAVRRWENEQRELELRQLRAAYEAGSLIEKVTIIHWAALRVLRDPAHPNYVRVGTHRDFYTSYNSRLIDVRDYSIEQEPSPVTASVSIACEGGRSDVEAAVLTNITDGGGTKVPLVHTRLGEGILAKPEHVVDNIFAVVTAIREADARR